MEEATPSQTLRIPPFKDRPLAVLEQVLDDADHLGYLEISHELFANSLAALDRLFRNLMIDRVNLVKRGKRIDVCPIKSVHPRPHRILRTYGTHLGDYKTSSPIVHKGDDRA